MARVILPAALRALAGGDEEIEIEGRTAAEVLDRLVRRSPGLEGRVVDETGRLRPHVSLFVNDQQAALDAPVEPRDRIYVVPAISGGASGPDRVEVLAGTRKGLFVLRGRRGGALDVVVRQFPGEVVEYAVRDPRTGRCYASVTHGQFGPRVFLADDPAGDWEQSDGPAFPEDAGVAVERIWVVQPGVEAAAEKNVLWAGVAPAALFKSTDGGRSWSLVRGLWDQPTRPQWGAGAGGQCLHSICPWPGDPARLSVAVSAAGVWHTEDGGATWHRGVQGLVPRYLPEPAREGALNLCVHNLHRAPLEPTTFYLQFHGGVYRSDDTGESWIDVGGVGRPDGLPADFGFPMAIDPRDPDRAYVIPLVADVDRVTPEGKVRVYETRDRGATWQPRGEGLPQRDAWLTVLRQAFGHDGGDPLGLYFGAESGDLFASADGGATWTTAARGLPPIYSVRAAAG